jgi:small subunit ribosomal protein S16
MALKLRSQRFGSNKNPQYRIVATDSKNPRDGRYLEIVGTYNPQTNPVTFTLNEEKVMKWLQVGAKPTDTVKTLLTSKGIIAKFTEQKKVK